MAKGDAEYAALVAALEDHWPGCRGDDRFLADEQDLDAADLLDMKATCRECPVAGACAVYALTARPPAGMWNGSYFTPRSRRTATRGTR